MKQQLWIVNISLIAIFVVALIIDSVLTQKPPKIKIRRVKIEKKEEKRIPLKKEQVDPIYTRDIFGTYTYIPRKPVEKSLLRLQVLNLSIL